MTSKKSELFSAPWLVLDGCRSGWIACYINPSHEILFAHLSDNDLIHLSPSTQILVDIPVNLPLDYRDYPRHRDVRAKGYLGKFHSSIFYAPLRSWLNKTLLEINQDCAQHNKPKLSIQSYNLFPKIKSIQSLLSTHKVIEIHPELLVHDFLGTSKQSKKTKYGQDQRLQIIQHSLSLKISISEIQNYRQNLIHTDSKFDGQIDDIIDALFVAHVVVKLGVKSMKPINTPSKLLQTKLWLFSQENHLKT